MPSREEVLRSLNGAWRLAWLDRSGMSYFDLSVEGFWRSFFAAVLVAPGYALLVAQKLLANSEELSPIWALVVESTAYVLMWAAFPVVAIGLTQLLGLARNYSALIIAANWAAVLQIAAFLVAVGVAFVVPPLGSLLVTLATGAILFYQWFVVRTALQTTGGLALAVVLVDLLVNTAINLSAQRLL
jgi:hypothetical protein